MVVVEAAGVLRLVDTGLGGLVSVIAVSAFGRVEVNLDALGADGSQRFQVELPVSVGTPLGWEFRAVDVHGREHRISWPIQGDQGEPIGGGSGDACWQRSITGYCNLMADWVVAEAESVTVAEDVLSIEVRLSGLQPSDCEDARLKALGRAPTAPMRARRRPATTRHCATNPARSLRNSSDSGWEVWS